MARSEAMNITSDISINKSNVSDSLFSNDGVMKSHFDIILMADVISVVFGLPANSYVIWLIVTGTGNGLAAEFFSLNLLVCEIIYGLKTLWTLFDDTFSIRYIGAFFTEGLAITGRPLFQCLICVERYLAVVRPVTFLKYKPLRYRAISSVVVWVATFGSSGVLITLLYSFHFHVFLGFILAQLLIFLSVQLFCCFAVLRALKQSSPGERGREREEGNHMKRKAFYLILISAVTMTITYSPFSTSLFFFLSRVDSALTVMSIGIACFALGGLVQPALFLYRVGKLPSIKCQ